MKLPFPSSSAPVRAAHEPQPCSRPARSRPAVASRFGRFLPWRARTALIVLLLSAGLLPAAAQQGAVRVDPDALECVRSEGQAEPRRDNVVTLTCRPRPTDAPQPALSAAADQGCRSVRRYGARFDGSTDDTRAVQAAVDAVLQESGGTGGCVSLPAGTTVLCQVDLRDPKEGLRIVGSGVGSTIIKPCSPRTRIFSRDVAAAQGPSAQFIDIGFFSILPDSKADSGAWFVINHTYGVRIHDITARLGWDFAELTKNNNTEICNTDLRTFRGTVFTLDGGFDARWCRNNNYDDSDLSDGEVSAYLLVRSFGGLMVDAVDAIHCGDCFTLAPTARGTGIDWVFFNQTQGDSCNGAAFRLSPAAGTFIKGFHGQGIWGASCRTGFLTEGEGAIDGVFLTTPRLLGNQGWGADFDAGTGIDVLQPMIAGNDSANQRAGGVRFGPAVMRYAVRGGSIGTFMQFGDSQRTNLYLDGANGQKDVQILGVNLCGFRSGGAPLMDRARNPGTRRMIRDNLCYNEGD
jgi:hypothetical protein